jgi:hypothetical protein
MKRINDQVDKFKVTFSLKNLASAILNGMSMNQQKESLTFL